MTLRAIAHSLFEEAIALQSPSNIVRKSSETYELDFSNASRIFPVAIGKASVMMMDGLLDYLNKKHQSKIYKQPIVVSNPQLNDSTYDFRHIISSHPTPNVKSVTASKEILDYIGMSNTNDLVVFLISGGGSSLLSLPADGIELEDKIKLTNLLLASGCNINEINIVRKHVSKIKGGRLNSAALPSKTISLIISDVINDDLSSIASGPTVADLSTFSDAINVLNKYNIFDKAPLSVREHLKKGKDNSSYETPKDFSNNTTEIISSNNVFKETLYTLAKNKNFNVMKVDKPYENLAVDDAIKLFEQVNKINDQNTILISGGETLVNLTGTGKGGRNQEFALSFLKKYINSKCKKDICLYSVGTDGIDGPTDAAGAIVDNETVNNYHKSDLDIDLYLSNNDSYSFFEKTKSLVQVGATGTNVADIQITIIK
jgi:hydroxypyruvate reductase